MLAVKCYVRCGKNVVIRNGIRLAGDCITSYVIRACQEARLSNVGGEVLCTVW